MSRVKLLPERWGYCERCACPSYQFECCGNRSCTGGGCKVCGGDSPVYLEVQRCIAERDLPDEVRTKFDGVEW